MCGLYTQAVLVKNTLSAVKSPERCTAALQDAADANKRLCTWVELLQPSFLGRVCLLIVEVGSS